MTDAELFAAARAGNLAAVSEAIDADPARLMTREAPYEWTLLHAAAHQAQLGVVDYLLKQGLDPNARESGDNTYAMHWAAAAGSVPVVRRLIEAGGDVVGHGDDHALDVIGWATCWDGCDDDAHREVVGLLTENGARHHIFSAIAMNLSDEVRRIVHADPASLAHTRSRHEHRQLPLQFAVQHDRSEMVRLLLDLGADPRATDSAGMSAAGHASWPRVSLEIVQVLRDAGLETPFTCVLPGDFEAAERLLGADTKAAEREGTLHMLAKRGDVKGTRWLLDRGSDVNALWNHWDAYVTPLHMAIMQNQIDVVRVLLERGADPSIKDSMHDGNSIDWADHFGHAAIANLLHARAG